MNWALAKLPYSDKIVRFVDCMHPFTNVIQECMSCLNPNKNGTDNPNIQEGMQTT